MGYWELQDVLILALPPNTDIVATYTNHPAPAGKSLGNGNK